MTDIETRPEFRVTVRVRNNRLVSLREASGLTVDELCRIAEVQVATYYALASLRLSAKTVKGEWRASVKRLATHYRCLEDDLFPASLAMVTRPTSEREVSAADVHLLCAPQEQERVALLSPSPEEAYEIGETREAIADAVGTLRPREQYVINMRFGTAGKGAHTLEEVGIDMGVTRERVRMIEAKALYKLRDQFRRAEIKRRRTEIEVTA